MEWMMLFGLGGGTAALFEGALLVCMFWVAVARPERIRSLSEFRAAYLLLGAAIAMPVLFVFLSDSSRGPASGMSDGSAALKYITGLQWVSLTLAVLLGLDSVAPRNGA